MCPNFCPPPPLINSLLFSSHSPTLLSLLKILTAPRKETALCSYSDNLKFPNESKQYKLIYAHIRNNYVKLMHWSQIQLYSTFFEVIRTASLLKASSACWKSSWRAGQQFNGGFRASNFLIRLSLTFLNTRRPLPSWSLMYVDSLLSNLIYWKDFPLFKLTTQ